MLIFKIFKEQNEAKGVYAYRVENPKKLGQFFINLLGNTFPIKDKLQKIGFKFFNINKTWSIPDFKFNENIKKELESYGVDVSELQTLPTQKINSVNDKKTKTEETIEKMQDVVEDLKNKLEDKTSKKLMDDIENFIEKLAASTDQASTQEIIVNFLKFQSKIYQYSFGNQMLIWIQTRGKATEVHSPDRWKKMGRVVTKFDKPIVMIRPNIRRIKNLETENGVDVEKEKSFISGFAAYNAYDISDTQPIPGYPSPYMPLTRKDWSVDSNESREEIENMINSLVEWIKSQNINVDYEEMSEEMGGYSAGGKIAINNTFKGINLLSVLIHETAHEILHWLERKRKKEGDMPPLSRQQKEIDAESTAYVVLSHFGFETKDAPNYLALWRAKGEDIRKRREDIRKASEIIINGIKQKAKETKIEFDSEVEEKISKFDRLFKLLKG
jgi:hypothetical protein